MADACGPACGYCGACTGPWEGSPLTVFCLYCNQVAPNQATGQDYYPYCSKACADAARRENDAERKSA